jgi:prophage antirepressor-like protein
MTEESLTRLVEVAEEQLRWLRASVLPDVRKTIEATLTTTQLRRAYEMCDGDTLAQAVAAAVDSSPPTLSRWADAGAMSESRTRRRRAGPSTS